MNITLHFGIEKHNSITNSFTLRFLQNYCGNTGRITDYKIHDHLGKYICLLTPHSILCWKGHSLIRKYKFASYLMICQVHVRGCVSR